MKNFSLRVVISLAVAFSFNAGCVNRENARNLKLQGLKEFVCGVRPYDVSKNTCNERSIWLEADTGLVAYVTIYGIQSKQEAINIAAFVAELKKKNKQNIPISLIIYSAPREKKREPSNAIILKVKI